MGVVATAKPQGKDFEDVSEMIQQAILADIVDKGDVPNKFKPGTTQHKAYFVWILAELDSEGRNKRAFQSFTVSLHEKASLRKILKEFGVKVTKDPANPKQELFNGQSDIDLEGFIGTARTLVMSLEDSTDGGKPFLRILATQKPQGPAVEIPADFKRKQDQD
jgi:hypothetical protein